VTDDDSDETDSVLRGVAAAPARLPPKLDVQHADTAPGFVGIARGVLLLGRYEIVGELGRGGMGRVFGARDRRLDRDVAVKVLVGEPNDARAFARIEQEARAASRINHPNIATVYDVLATDYGPCIVSELLEGATLRDELGKSGARSVDEARKMGAQLAAGLTAAHERGVLHRDLKPANLFVTTDRRLKILDFGLAKLVEPHPDSPRTEDGAVLGTSGYMSPEQVRGQPADERSDLFSAGIVLYEMLMGCRPFEGASRYEIDSRILDAPPAPLRPDIPADLAATVLRCLEKDPALRFQSGRELAAAVDGTTPSERIPASRPSALRARLGWAALIAVVAASAGVVWLGKTRHASTPAGAAPPSIAVLPFRDLSPDKAQQYLSDGIAEDILTSLARLDGLRVAGRTSSFSFRDANDDARTIGRKLGVGALLEGSVRRVGERVRIAVRLINAADGYQLWAQDFDRGTADLLAVEDEVARDIVGALKVKLIAGEHATASHAARDPKAYEEYLLAKRQLESGAAESARHSIERALARDPQFAAAWAESARIFLARFFTDVDRPTGEALVRRATEAAEKAIALDPELPDGFIVRSVIRSDGGAWDLKGAVADMERASAISPNDAETLGLKAHLLLFFSHRVDEAIALYRRVAELDPLDGGAWQYLAYGYREARRFEEERAALKRALEISPEDSLSQAFVAELEIHDGHFDEALALFDANPDRTLRLVGRAWVLDRLHRSAESRAALAELEEIANDGPFFVGNAYALTGDLDRAFRHFELAFEHGDVALVDIAVSPWLDNVRRDPRYPPLLRKMGLLDEPAAVVPSSVAVLPFRDLSADKKQQYLADGIAEELLTSLARVDGLRVAGRVSSFSFRDSADDARTIGQKLGVGALLEGSVQRAGKRVRISARLVNAADGYQLWAQDFDRGGGDLLAVEDEVTRGIVDALKMKLVPGAHALPSNRGSHDPEAYNDYLLATRESANPSYKDLVEARHCIERALARDPGFAAGWARYAYILVSTVFTDGVNERAVALELFAVAKKAADKAIALDPNLPDGYVARGRWRYHSGAWDLLGARSDLEHALALDPNNPQALADKAQLLLFFSHRVDEGIATAKRAAEVDPINPTPWYMLGFGYRRAGRLAEAKAAYQRAFEIFPGDAGVGAFIAEIEMREGHPEKALAMFDAMSERGFEYRHLGRAMVLMAMHRDAEARAAVRNFEVAVAKTHYSAYLGCAYAVVGDLDRAFAMFETCLAHGDIALADVMVAPWTESLRENPRYKAFVAKMYLLD
jgi:eukaryotic-like serine/threonine-protein kinase